MEDTIIFNIDVMLAKRKMSVTELAEKVGITMANISILKNGKAKAIKVSTLAKLCEACVLSVYVNILQSGQRWNHPEPPQSHREGRTEMVSSFGSQTTGKWL